MHTGLQFLLTVIALRCVEMIVCGGERPVVAIARGDTIYLAGAGGRVVDRFRTGVAIESFSVSPDRSRVVFVEKSRRGLGGRMYLARWKAKRLDELTGGPYLTPLPESDREVYGEPAFSPDGRSVAFIVRQIPRDELADTSVGWGVVAILDSATREVKVLRSTLDVDAAYTGSPEWSWDGSRILVAFEVGFAVLGADGSRLKVFEGLSGHEWSGDVGWVGEDCVLAGFGRDGVVGGTRFVRVMADGFAEESKAPRGPLARPGINRVQVSGDLLLVEDRDGSGLYRGPGMKLVGRFPRGARLLDSGGR